MKTKTTIRLAITGLLTLLVAGQLRATAASAVAGVEPLPAEWTRGNVGIFIGVGKFRQQHALNGSGNDAIVLAHVFVNELRLVPPNRAFLVFEDDLSPQAAQMVKDLRARGVSVRETATKADIIGTLQQAASVSVVPDSFLFFGASSHGCQDRATGTPYMLPSDEGDTFESFVCLTTEVRDPLKRFAGASRQILFVDACRNNISLRSKALGETGGARFPVDKAALANMQANVLVGACSPGQTSLLDTRNQISYFTKGLRDALRGKAAMPGNPHLTLGQVLAHVSVEVEKEVGDLLKGSKDEGNAQRAWYEGEVSALSMPLARVSGAAPAAGQTPALDRLPQLVAWLQQSLRAQPEVINATNRATGQQVAALLSSPAGGTYTALTVELELLLPAATTNKSQAKELAAMLQRFREREQRRTRLLAVVSGLRQSPADTTAPERDALERLETLLKTEMPPAVDSLCDEVEKHFAAGDAAKNRAGLAWWVSWDRARRRDQIVTRLGEAQRQCGLNEVALGYYRGLLQAVKSEPADDAVLGEVEMRLTAGSCQALETTLNWWLEQQLEGRRTNLLALLAGARAEHAGALTGRAESLDRLVYVLGSVSSTRLQDLLAGIEKRFSASRKDRASFDALLGWWQELERQQRIAEMTVLIAGVATTRPAGNSSQESLTQIIGALGKYAPAQADELLNELDRRLDVYDSGSIESLCNWWKEYRNRERRLACITRLVEAAKRSPTEARGETFRQLTNSVRVLSAREVEPILREIEVKISSSDSLTLRQLLSWFEKRFLAPPSWSVVVAVTEGATDSKQANDLATAFVKQFQTKFFGAKVKFHEQPLEIVDEAEIASFCRELDAKAVLLIRLLPPETRRDPNSVLGPVTVADVSVQVAGIKVGSPIQTSVFRGNYIDPRNNPMEHVIRKAYEDAVQKASNDASLAEALGLKAGAAKR